MSSEVVVFDPDGRLGDGKVMRVDPALAQAKRQGIVTIPTLSDVPRTALSPFAKFSYGDGLEVSETIPGFVGSAALFLRPGGSRVAWAAMLRTCVGAPVPVRGLLRLIGDARQAPAVQAPVSDDPGNQATLGAPAAIGASWLILAGSVGCRANGTFAGFALHGWARGCRLAWLAVSQCE
jgi:hypothetical protein